MYTDNELIQHVDYVHGATGETKFDVIYDIKIDGKNFPRKLVQSSVWAKHKTEARKIVTEYAVRILRQDFGRIIDVTK